MSESHAVLIAEITTLRTHLSEAEAENARLKAAPKPRWCRNGPFCPCAECGADIAYLQGKVKESESKRKEAERKYWELVEKVRGALTDLNETGCGLRHEDSCCLVEAGLESEISDILALLPKQSEEA